MLVVQEDSDEENEIEEEFSGAEVSQMAEVSLNSLVGLTIPKTLRARGSVGVQPVVVLIDPGATHNFILRKLIEVLKILIFATASYRVQLGNGDNISTTGVCQSVRLQLQGIKIIEDFIPLNLGSIDIILGI